MNVKKSISQNSVFLTSDFLEQGSTIFGLGFSARKII